MSAFAKRIRIDPAYLGFIAAAVLWGITVFLSGGRGAYDTMSVALAFAIFAVTVGTGQMFVISSGPGNIDLSSPAVMTLAAYLSMNTMAGNGWMLPFGLAVALLSGVAMGVFNYGLIKALSIPPIIATLATSFIVLSLAMNSGGATTVKPPPELASFTSYKIAGVQVMLVLAVTLTAIIHIVVKRTAFGRRLMAVGQNERAAQLAGVPAGRVRMLAYAISGALAGLAGFLLAGFTGGAALNMGDSYLMQSVAVAVLGGTSVAGGRANAIGIWGAALFLGLLTTLLTSSGVAVGWQFILSGAVIILVVVLVTEKR